MIYINCMCDDNVASLNKIEVQTKTTTLLLFNRVCNLLIDDLALIR